MAVMPFNVDREFNSIGNARHDQQPVGESDMPSDNENHREQLIYGVWYGHDLDDSGETFVLQRESLLPNGFGRRYEFHEDGKLIDAVSSRCGNQPGLHRWSGIWEIDRKRNLLRMRIERVDNAGDPHYEPNNPSEDYKNGKEFLLTELTDHKLVLSSSQS